MITLKFFLFASFSRQASLKKPFDWLRGFTMHVIGPCVSFAHTHSIILTSVEQTNRLPKTCRLTFFFSTFGIWVTIKPPGPSQIANDIPLSIESYCIYASNTRTAVYSEVLLLLVHPFRNSKNNNNKNTISSFCIIFYGINIKKMYWQPGWGVSCLSLKVNCFRLQFSCKRNVDEQSKNELIGRFLEISLPFIVAYGVF